MKVGGVMVNLHSLLTVWLEGDSPFSLGYSLSFPVELGLVFLFNFRTVWTRTTIKSIYFWNLKGKKFEDIFVGLTPTIEAFKVLFWCHLIL